jgi:hypothetical protein
MPQQNEKGVKHCEEISNSLMVKKIFFLKNLNHNRPNISVGVITPIG